MATSPWFPVKRRIMDVAKRVNAPDDTVQTVRRWFKAALEKDPDARGAAMLEEAAIQYLSPMKG